MRVPLTLVRLVLSRKVCSSPAYRSLLPCQNQCDSGVLAALMASTWRLRQQCAMKSSIPVNYPWGSARSCRVAPVHFRPPIASPVLSLHVRAPLPVPRGPPAKGPVCNKEVCHPGEPPWGSARSSCEAPIHFRPHFTTWGGFEFSSHERAGLRAAVVDDEGSAFLVNYSGQQAVVLLPDPRHVARGRYLSAHVQI
jgi:hypothetical protein